MSPRHFRINIAKSGFLPPIQKGFLPLSVNGICIHLNPQVPPASGAYFPFSLCLSCDLLANSWQLSSQAYPKSFLQVILSLALLEKASKWAFCAPMCSAQNTPSGLLTHTSERSSLPTQNSPMAPHCFEDEIQILYRTSNVSHDAAPNYVSNSILCNFLPCPFVLISVLPGSWGLLQKLLWHIKTKHLKECIVAQHGLFFTGYQLYWRFS